MKKKWFLWFIIIGLLVGCQTTTETVESEIRPPVPSSTTETVESEIRPPVPSSTTEPETSDVIKPTPIIPPQEETAEGSKPETSEVGPEPIRPINPDPETTVESQPKTVQLTVRQSVQENAYYCVPAVVQMALDYYGIVATQTDLADEMKTHHVTGTEYVDTANTLNRYLFGDAEIEPGQAGYRVQTLAIGADDPELERQFEDRVKDNLANNYFVYVAVDVNRLYPEQKSGNHMLLVTGYTLEDNSDRIASYYVVDPSYVVQDPSYGGLKIVPHRELFEAIIYNEEPAYIW